MGPGGSNPSPTAVISPGRSRSGFFYEGMLEGALRRGGKRGLPVGEALLGPQVLVAGTVWSWDPHGGASVPFTLFSRAAVYAAGRLDRTVPRAP
jgi:hypothetical protein